MLVVGWQWPPWWNTPFAELMSDERAHTVAQRRKVLAAYRACGCALQHNMQLSFLALVVIPTSHFRSGLVDVTKFDFVPVLV